METLSQAAERLKEAGYREDFRAEPGGLRAAGSDCVHAPEQLVIEEVVRFEGASDPEDEAILFALRCEVHGTQGTFAVAYGPRMDPLDVEMVRRLSDGRRRLADAPAGPPGRHEGESVRVSAQVSLFPLRQEKLGPGIEALVAALGEAGLEVNVGAMSTLVAGEAGALFRALGRGFERAAEHGAVALVVTVSNACPVRSP
jgi:uncharacterized protein YqgV (UPF0045/DUF77 family)